MPARLAVNKAAKFTGSGADALSGKKVGVVAGSRHEQMLKAFFPKAAAEGFDGYEPMYDALKKARWMPSSPMVCACLSGFREALPKAAAHSSAVPICPTGFSVKACPS